MKLKNILFIAGVFIAASLSAQYKITPTDTLRITGKVKYPQVLTLAALDTFRATTISEVDISHGKGEAKETIKNLKGILLKDLFQNIGFDTDEKKSLNRFYLVFSATDGFRLVLSWNEIFHTNSCTNYYLITGMNGKKINDSAERLMIMEISDTKTGHKRIEGLGTINFQQVN